MYNINPFNFVISSAGRTWLIVSLILAIIGGILVYYLFLTEKNENKFKGFLKGLYDFLGFKKPFLLILLKITYLMFAIFITLSSFALIEISFLKFVLYLIIGNLIVRIVYELCLMLALMCRDVAEINRKIR